MDKLGLLKRWRCPGASRGDGPESLGLARQLGVPPLVAQLLRRRGYADAARARAFLEPSLRDQYDPAELPGASAAAERLAQAVRCGEPIVIYGDYDVDGITATAILWHTLKLVGAKVSSYTPHRIDEGYGLNTRAIGGLARDHRVIVSVDCGITAVEPARAAVVAGADLIITDHHRFDPDRLPEAYALVHPRLPGSVYPFPDLCGAGVAFKLAWLFARAHFRCERVPEEFRALLLDLLSYVALGTIADVVPLWDENRVMTVYGLGQVKRTRFVGLNALIDAAGLRDEKIDCYHVGFVLAPRLNAAGRMGHAAQAIELLTTDDPEEATRLARFLTRQNQERRATEQRVFDHARQMILEAGFDRPEHRAIVLGHEGWHPGVLGIVAARLVEAFARPVVLLHYDDGLAHGSARSIPVLSIHEALGHCAGHLSSFGGHAMAAGLRLPIAHVDRFREDLARYAAERLGPADLNHVLDIDAECTLDDVDPLAFAQIQRLAPFGAGNPAPVLCAQGVQLHGPPQRVGPAGKHLRLTVRQNDRLASAVGFGLGDLAEKLTPGAAWDVAFEPRISTWQNRRRAEMNLKDLRRSG